MNRDEAKESVMNRSIGQKTAVLTAIALVAATFLSTVGTVSAATRAIELCALPGSLALPGTTVPIWGFGQATTPGDCTTAVATLPGPVLTVDEGDVVSIRVINALPAGHTISFEIPGLNFDPGASDADPGTSVTRTFAASAPGTYLYQSGGDAGRQEAMGLYGALIVRPLTAGQAYDTAQSAYDVETALVLSQIDPAFNANPETYDMYAYNATYWLINGAAYPDTAPIRAAAGQRVLLRYLNGGRDNTSMQLIGAHQQVLARDAYLLNNPYRAATELLPAGATADAIVVVPAAAPPSANGFALFNRNLHVTNGSPSSAQPSGGMLTFIKP
jgi:FtsP/CotA-like multicopper oxidase with cupredoxin domain